MDIKLKEGEVICDNCHGKTKSFGESVTVCTKCWGTGKLDWIDLCVGKKHPDSVFFMPKLKKMYPKLISKDLLSIQPMR
jgi:RecJ-like exonuclease